MAKTMRAAVLEKFNSPYIIKDLPMPPEPENHDILIQVLAASYCHTDAVFCSGAMSQELPRIGCHEFAGRVVGLGPFVRPELGLKKDTEVGVPGRAYHPCTQCIECTFPSTDPIGYSPYCVKAKNLGLTADGGFQEYCLVDSRQVAPIPAGMTAVETAPLMCAGLTIWAALQREEIKYAKSVAIIGAAGGLGHLGVQFAVQLGKQVLAIDKGSKAMEMLEQVVHSLGEYGNLVSIIDVDGEKDMVNRALDRVAQSVSARGPKPRGVDAIIVLPEVQSAFDFGISLLKDHGTAVVVSFPEKGFNVSAKDLVFRDIRVVGSLVGRNSQLKDMLAFAAKHQTRARVKTFPLEELNTLVEAYHKGEYGKLVVDMVRK